MSEFPSNIDPKELALATPASLSVVEEEPVSSLPIDPIRLLGGLRKRWWWVLVGLAIGLLIGGGVAALKTKTRFVVSVQLIQRELPAAFRVGETGEAFRPNALATGTLVGAAAAPAVLQRVAAKSSPQVSAGALQGAIEVKEQRGTDFVFLTLSGFQSPQATVDLANLWATEVVQFSRELQSQESREIRQFLQRQVDATDMELVKLNEQILDFTKREKLVNADKQIDAYLRSIGDLDLKYEGARIDLETIDFKIKGFEDELRRQSPLSEKLRFAQVELEDLRSRYTDQNPLVIEKMEAMRAVENQIQADAAQLTDPSNFAGTFLGNTLYLNLIQLQNDKKALSRQKDELEKLRNIERGKLDAIPEKAAAFGQLSLRRQSLETARSLLFNRLREAQLFEENSPGYYRVFAPATADRVITSGKMKKGGIITIAGGGFFAATALLAALLMELLDPKLRTQGEAARTFKMRPLASVRNGATDPSAGPEIWAHWIGTDRKARQPRVVWSPRPSPEEDLFWNLLFARAAKLLPALRVVNCGDSPLPSQTNGTIQVVNLDPATLSIADAEKIGGDLREAARHGEEIWIRLCGPMHEPLTTIASFGQAPLVLVDLHAASTAFWDTQSRLLHKTVGRPAGIVTVGEIPWEKWT